MPVRAACGALWTHDGAVRGRGLTRTAPARGTISVMQRRPLMLGDRAVWPPVVLAPMAGITNVAFRRLCREYGAGLYVSEMVTTRALVERDRESMRMVAFAPDESPRSVQLYGVDPDVVRRAVRMVVGEEL